MVAADVFAHEWLSLSEEDKEKRLTIIITKVKSLYSGSPNPNAMEVFSMDEGESPRRSTRSTVGKRTPPSVDPTSGKK